MARLALPVAEQDAELAKLREILVSVSQMPAKGARWVEVQFGPASEKTWARGWHLGESKTEVRLLTAEGYIQAYDKTKLATKKILPRSSSGPMSGPLVMVTSRNTAKTS